MSYISSCHVCHDRSIFANDRDTITHVNLSTEQQIRTYGLGVRVHAPPQCLRQNRRRVLMVPKLQTATPARLNGSLLARGRGRGRACTRGARSLLARLARLARGRGRGRGRDLRKRPLLARGRGRLRRQFCTIEMLRAWQYFANSNASATEHICQRG